MTNHSRVGKPTALVTGASSGMGAATVKVLVREGWAVVGCDIIKPREDGPDFIEHDDVHHVIADVSVPHQCDQLVSEVLARHGRIDAIANVAGINDGFTPAHRVSDALWSRVIEVDLAGPFRLIRAALPAFIEQRGGAIVNVASVAGLSGAVSGAAYTTAKHGLIGLTRSVAASYRDYSVRCNVICPGAFTTGIAQTDSPEDPWLHDLRMTWRAKANPSAEPAEVGELIAYLFSESARSINGAVLPIDGGWMA